MTGDKRDSINQGSSGTSPPARKRAGANRTAASKAPAGGVLRLQLSSFRNHSNNGDNSNYVSNIRYSSDQNCNKST